MAAHKIYKQLQQFENSAKQPRETSLPNQQIAARRIVAAWQGEKYAPGSRLKPTHNFILTCLKMETSPVREFEFDNCGATIEKAHSLAYRPVPRPPAVKGC